MNFLGLQKKVIQKLRERPYPNPARWGLDEIKDALNEGQNEFVAQAGLFSQTVNLIPAEPGAYYIPYDIKKRGQFMYYQGLPLPFKTVDFLDSRYSGTGHNTGHVGVGLPFASNFRSREGQPICAYVEDGKYKLFPRPETTLSLDTISESIEGTIMAGDTGITLSTAIPTDQSRVRFYYGGVYQNKDQWRITSPNRIDFIKTNNTTWTAVSTNDFEIAFIPDHVSASVVYSVKKFLVNISTGATRINVPGGYVQGIGALEIAINGITIAPSTFIESSRVFVTLVTPATTDSVAEISVRFPDPLNAASLQYTPKMPAMVADADEPAAFIPEEFHKGIWQYACYELLGLTDGKRTQDLQTAALFFKQFQATVSDAMSLADCQMEINYDAALPFKL